MKQHHVNAQFAFVKEIVRQHMSNASQFLNSYRSVSPTSQDDPVGGGLCRRWEASLDALRIAGEGAITIGQLVVEDDAEVASVVALLLAESESDRSGASAQAVALLRRDSLEVWQSAWWGLRLASCRHVEPHLRALLGQPKWDCASAAALDILAFHRLPVSAQISPVPDPDSEEVAWLLAEAGGRIPGVWTSDHFVQHLAHPSPRVREAALRAAARSGLGTLPGICRDAANGSGPAEAVSFLGVVGAPHDLPILQQATSNPTLAPAAISALGRLGFPDGVRILIGALSEPDLARAAAAAITRITGLDVPRGTAPTEPPPGLTELELDVWEPEAPVELTAIGRWWRSHAARFDPAKRHQAGLCVSDDPLGPVFDQLPLNSRHDVYLRERALVAGTPDWELETWPRRQRSPAG